MKKTLFEAVKQYKTLSISGICKNAGKTTALNSLIECAPPNETLALTSIGRDGESLDTVTGTKKPGIYIREGSLLATAEKLLKSCDITKDILDTTETSTPLGDIILIRALSDGNVQLAGPSVVSQLKSLTKLFYKHGAHRIIIDGAAGRKSLCTRALSEASILCSGASYSASMEETIDETAHACTLLMTGEVHGNVSMSIQTENSGSKYIIIGKEKTALPDGADITSALKQAKDPTFLHIKGALTDNLLDSLIRTGLPKGLTIVTDDASKLLISAENLHRLEIAKGQLGVLESINLAAITINPYSAFDNHYDEIKFMEGMQKAVPIPVINVM